MRAIVAALLVGGCYNPAPPAGVPCGEGDVCPSGQQCIAGFCGGGTVDPDAEVIPDVFVVDAAPLCTTWTAEHFDPCALPAPMGDLTLMAGGSSPYELDSATGALEDDDGVAIPVATMVLEQTSGPNLRIVSVSNLTIEAGARLDLDGNLPVLIAVWDTATIAGELDASASLSSAGPNGSNGTSGTCGGAPTGDSGAAAVSTTPAVGGGGGGFGANGGRGGNTTGGAGQSLAVPAVVRGGCGGGNGGGNTDATPVNGTRGAGGGAVVVSARVKIDVLADGEIDAGGGGGGLGHFPLGGGGGGGAGGYIGLDAPMVNVAGVLSANGGSGGGGASDTTDGSNGSNGLKSANAANGGAGAATSGVGTCTSGASGSSAAVKTGQNAAASPCGGSGGGGGAGYIFIWSPAATITGTVSPAPTTPP